MLFCEPKQALRPDRATVGHRSSGHVCTGVSARHVKFVHDLSIGLRPREHRFEPQKITTFDLVCRTGHCGQTQKTQQEAMRRSQ